MWQDISISLVTSVSEAICVNFMNKKKREKLNNKISEIVSRMFDEFTDTSLDSDVFFQIVCSKAFEEILRNYFISIRDGLGHLEYKERVEAYICKNNTLLNKIEVRRFINKIYELYTEFLYTIIEENYELNAVVQMLTISHREILNKILESEDNLSKYLIALDKSAIMIDEKDIITYHNVCNKEFNKIRFTGISGAEDKTAQELDIFYVENTFSYYNKVFSEMYHLLPEKVEELHLNNFFDYGNKIVLIGAAGLGKSTTLNYLFCNYEQLFNSNALKLKIDLKEYAKDIVEDKKDVLWCLSTEFYKRVKRKKIQFQEVESIIASYLDRGACLVILDALDEIPTQQMRNTVRNEISNFCELYYLNRFIISTREVGYLKNKFDDTFLHIKINEFNKTQIKEYSKNWFRMNYKQGEFKIFWGKFNNEVEKSKCSNLIRNPIVLILALVIFDIEKNLPNRRVEFYKKCIDTFLIVREDRKAAFHMTEKIKNILGDDLVVPKIAYYKFKHIGEDPKYKFTSEEVKNSIMEAIEVPDKINWREPVSQYARYLVDRTELLGEIDDDKYDFAHKTFYEYFLAVYFSKELDNFELVELLKVWIGDSNNDELARLIIEVIIEKNEPKQHKYIIDFLFEQIEEESLKTREEYSKEDDIFYIVSELYKNNMLLPKFHDKYYKCILYHSKIVKRMVQRGRMKEKVDVNMIYDVNILTQYFINEIKRGIFFNEIIDSMYNLNTEFKNQVVQDSDGDLMEHILQLFLWVQNNIPEHKKVNNKNSDIELKYFLEEHLELTLSCPQIYMSIIDYIVLKNKIELIPRILHYKFKEYNVFYNYTSPQILLLLIDRAYNSDKEFLILLISIIQCAKNCTNDLLAFVLSFYKRGGNKEEYEKNICEKVILFWKIMNKSETLDSFIEQLTELSLYNKEYNNIYEKLLNGYKTREQAICRRRILREIEVFNKNVL